MDSAPELSPMECGVNLCHDAFFWTSSGELLWLYVYQHRYSLKVCLWSRCLSEAHSVKKKNAYSCCRMMVSKGAAARRYKIQTLFPIPGEPVTKMYLKPSAKNQNRSNKAWSSSWTAISTWEVINSTSLIKIKINWCNKFYLLLALNVIKIWS